MDTARPILLLIIVATAYGYSPLRDRIAVVHGEQYEAFYNRDQETGGLLRATSPDGINWTTASLPVITTSTSCNPSAIYVQNNTTPLQVAFLSASTNSTSPYIVYEAGTSGNFKYEPVGSKSSSIPANLPANEWSPDSVVIRHLHGATFAFVRSQEHNSQLYWCYTFSVGADNWTKWEKIGDGSTNLASDVSVAVNTFLKRFELFAVMDDGKLYQAWQTDKFVFSNWHGMGIDSPTFNSAPAAHEMTQDFFNGMLQVFVRGTDNFIHHISQTTCDKVNNPWGPCTWDVTFSRLSDNVAPGSAKASNPITVGSTIHGGLEVFILSDDYKLYRTYQLERGDGWYSWHSLGPVSDGNAYATIPAIFVDTSGWWNALAIGSSDGKLHTYQQPRTLTVDQSILYSHNATAKWEVPNDDASRTDELAIYKVNEVDNLQYFDFRYVGGKQNPTGEPVRKGSIEFTLFLPDGDYEVRYMASLMNPPLLKAKFSSSNQSSAPEWEQLYRGIALGLGNMSQDYVKCVDDGNLTIAAFEQAFADFRDRKVINGLHYFAQGLSDVRDAIVDCGDTPLLKYLEEFIAALISCTEERCLNFVIDVVEILLIFYENEYEIYGDIRAADNCFNIAAYEQAGLAIGRVTYACLTLPQVQYNNL